jgi:predicted nucleic-acid-binding Zn-ribbon protein
MEFCHCRDNRRAYAIPAATKARVRMGPFEIASRTAFNWDAKKDAIMIIGKTNIDYFVILCEKCGSTTKNEYLGTDPMMPRFKATCPKCGNLGAFKLDAIDWSGLPPEPSTS